MSDASLLMERDGSVARLTLNRPAAANSINVALARALMEASIVCDEDDSIRCVLLTATGRMFCAGGDVTDFANAGEDVPKLLKEITSYLHAAIAHFARMNKPLVTAVNGPAAGAGFSLAMLGDLVLASRSAHFTLAYTAIGLSPDGGATWLLPRLVGLRRAQEMALTNRRLSADDAAAAGLITRAVDDASLLGGAIALGHPLGASGCKLMATLVNALIARGKRYGLQAMCEGGGLANDHHRGALTSNARRRRLTADRPNVRL